MTSVKKPEWSFYAAWILLTGLSVPAGFVIFFILSRVVIYFTGEYIVVDGVRHITEDFIVIYIIVPAAGLVGGLAQYALLRRTMPSMGWWVPATVLGWSVGALLTYGLMAVVSEFWSMEAYFGGQWAEHVAFLLLGLSIGFWQWLILRKRLSRAGWWIAANVAGWGLFALLFVNADRLGLEALVLSSMAGRFLTFPLWLLPGCVTAVCLALLMNQEPPVEPGVAHLL